MQGATENVVILSLARDGAGSPGSLADWARVNVSTTRECGLLVILGNRPLFQSCAPCYGLYRYCQMAGRAFEMFYTKLPPAGRYSRLDDVIQTELRCGLQAVMAALDRPLLLARRAEEGVMP